MELGRLIVPASDFTLASLRDLLDSAAARSDLVSDLHFRLNFVLEEICLNVRDHGQVPGRVIEIRLFSDPPSVIVRVADDGMPFDMLTDAPAPDLTSPLLQRQVGGLGVYLVRHLVDDVAYCRDGERNTLTLVLIPSGPEDTV